MSKDNKKVKKNTQTYKMPKVLRSDHVFNIEMALESGIRIFDYSDCVTMSKQTFIDLNNLFREYEDVKETNTKKIKKVTKEYYYDDFHDGGVENE